MSLQAIRLSGTKINTSALGFGTAGLVGGCGYRERIEMLESAFSVGVRHFDTAPYYGYGEAEKILGRFIRGRRNQVTVTTKFGIQPMRVTGLHSIAGLAKWMTHPFKPLRRMLSHQAGKLVQRYAFSVADAQNSLESSLRALNTDYIDIYLLHEAGPAETTSPELLSFLEDQVKKGIIRCYGIGSEFDRMLGVIAQNPAFGRVIQFESNVVTRNMELLPTTVGRAVITHRALGDAFKALRSRLGQEPALTARWSAELGCDCTEATVLGGLMLAYAVRANQSGVVLFSSRSRAHLVSNVEVVARGCFSDYQLSVFAELVATDLSEQRSPRKQRSRDFPFN